MNAASRSVTPVMKSRAPLPWPLILLVCAGAAAYANSFMGVFLFDDYRSIVEDPRLENVQTFLVHLPGMIRPLLKATLLADRLVWGANPPGYHLLNLALHLGSGLLLFGIVTQLVRDSSPSPTPRPSMVALGSALLFLVHPIGTETVTYLSGRATGLAAFFYLAAFLLYLRASERGRFPRVLSWSQAGAVACFALALLSKETAITFPLALLLAEIVARRTRGSSLRAVVVRLHTPIWAVLLLFLGAASMHTRYRELFDAALHIRPLYEHIVAQVNVIGYAVTLVALPGGLNFDHDFPRYASALVWPTPVSLALLVGMIALAVIRARTQPLLAFGIAWFFLQLLPTNSLLQRDDLLSERNLYLPAAGLFLVAALIWFALERRAADWLSHHRRTIPRDVLRVLPVVAVALLISGTLARNAIYHDAVAFWTDTVDNSPAKARPRVNLGHAYFLAGDFSRAAEQFRIALALDPGNPVAQRDLWAAWERAGATNITAGE
jgi:protein O-mannosyl-transferase